MLGSELLLEPHLQVQDRFHDVLKFYIIVMSLLFLFSTLRLKCFDKTVEYEKKNGHDLSEATPVF